MQHLRGPDEHAPIAKVVREVVVSSGVGSQQDTPFPGGCDILRRLVVCHSWLQQHQLLDRKGFMGMLTERQLAASGGAECRTVG